MLVLATTEIGSAVEGVASGISVATTRGVDVAGGDVATTAVGVFCTGRGVDVAGGDVATIAVGVLSAGRGVDVAGGEGVGVLSAGVEHAPTANNMADADAPNSNQTNKRLIPKSIFIVSFHLS